MNGFNTQTGEGVYRLQFETDNKSNFESMQALARMCVDGKEPVIRYSGEDEKTLIRWISVEERLPEDDTNVLVYAIGNNEESVVAMTSYTHRMYGYDIEGWRSPWQYFTYEYKITHWMPLPKEPMEE